MIIQKTLEGIKDKPLTSIALTLAYGLLVYGVLFLAITFMGNYQMSFPVLEGFASRVYFSVFWISCALPFIVSAHLSVPRFISYKRFIYVFVGILSITLLRLIVAGFSQITWIFLAMLCIIAAIVYLWMVTHARD